MKIHWTRQYPFPTKKVKQSKNPRYNAGSEPENIYFHSNGTTASSRKYFPAQEPVNRPEGVVQEGEVMVPSHSGSGGGLSTQLAVVGPHTALLWKQRLQHTLHRCRSKAVNVQQFLKSFTSENHITVRPLSTEHMHACVQPSGTRMSGTACLSKSSTLPLDI